jgi:hypothetical protein
MNTKKSADLRREAQRLRKPSNTLMRRREALTKQADKLRETSIILEKKLLMLAMRDHKKTI